MENNSVTRALGIAIYGEISPIIVTLTGNYICTRLSSQAKGFPTCNRGGTFGF